jgi:tRNA G10  N-methylase Trm11
MFITILGRQPALGMAELEQLYGSGSVQWFGDIAALVDAVNFDFERLGGSQKAGLVTQELRGDWHAISMKLVSEYTSKWATHSGKITLGISAYGFAVSSREVQKTGIILKARLKSQGVSLRLIPNNDASLNTAVSHHNKLGLSANHIELLVVRATSGAVVIAESVGAQNITALAARDQARPRTDAFVGMLPPKLARMMVNIGAGQLEMGSTVLDPFCGTGVVLQEAALLGYAVYGSDLSGKMADYTQTNLEWLINRSHISPLVRVEEADAMTHRWQPPFDAVVCETYLGQPFSAPPSPAKLTQVRHNCDYIVSTFLKNLAAQIPAGTPVCLAVPAWRDSFGHFTYLPLTGRLASLGFSRHTLQHVRNEELIYYREGQVVARQLLILSRGNRLC